MKTCKHCGDDGERGCDCIERITCPMAGELGHWQCGVCLKHLRPTFTHLSHWKPKLAPRWVARLLVWLRIL